MRAAGPGQPAHLLLDIVDLLEDMGIPYAVVGAVAVSFHGVPRSTNDADAAVWLEGSGSTRQDLKDRIAAAGYRTELKRGEIDDPVAGVLIIEDEFENRVDLILGIRGMDPEAVRRCIIAAMLDASVKIIAVEDLIAMKAFAGGTQDLEDVRGILQVSRNHLDLNLLRNLTCRYGLEADRTLEAILEEDL